MLQAGRRRKDATQRKAREFLSETLRSEKPIQPTHTDRTRGMQQRAINRHKLFSLPKTLKETKSKKQNYSNGAVRAEVRYDALEECLNASPGREASQQVWKA